MPEIESVYVDANKEVYSLSDTTARQRIVNLSQQVNEDIQDLRDEFQTSVDTICEHIEDKGSEVAKPHSLENVCDAIDAIQTGGNYDTLDVSFGPTGTTYNAEDYPGIDAQNIVRVVPPEAPFTVKFFDANRNLIQTSSNIPYGGTAHCNLLDGTLLDVRTFKGQNPMPTNVTNDMNCYPEYGEYVVNPNETRDSQETICADNGAHYPIGTYKNCLITVYGNKDINDSIANVKRYLSNYQEEGVESIYTSSDDNILLFQYEYDMMKVAEGEDGTTSTQISTNTAQITNRNLCVQQYSQEDDEMIMKYEEAMGMAIDYQRGFNNSVPCAHNSDQETCILRQFLNGKVFNNMPQALRQNIKLVNKFTEGMSMQSTAGTRVQKETLDKIQIPSIKELHTFCAAPNVSLAHYIVPSTLAELEEIDGIDYTTSQSPTYGKVNNSCYFLTRTNCLQNDYGYHSTVAAEVQMVNENAYNIYPQSYARNFPMGIPFGFCL